MSTACAPHFSTRRARSAAPGTPSPAPVFSPQRFSCTPRSLAVEKHLNLFSLRFSYAGVVHAKTNERKCFAFDAVRSETPRAREHQTAFKSDISPLKLAAAPLALANRRVTWFLPYFVSRNSGGFPVLLPVEPAQAEVGFKSLPDFALDS